MITNNPKTKEIKMKNITLIITISLFAIGSLFAQSSTTRLGNSYYHSDGSSTSLLGNTYYNSGSNKSSIYILDDCYPCN